MVIPGENIREYRSKFSRARHKFGDYKVSYSTSTVVRALDTDRAESTSVVKESM